MNLAVMLEAPPVASESTAGTAGRARTKKAPNAFRTISEVADDLHIPQHVLRFWETKFPQLKPLKRGGGRRYYRPDDIQLLRGIADLLYTQGYTIKGVQRLLRESGGKLDDNIPPASEADQAPEPPEPEMESLALFPDQPAVPPVASAAPSDISATPPPADNEADMLRHVLAELERLRSLLD